MKTSQQEKDAPCAFAHFELLASPVVHGVPVTRHDSINPAFSPPRFSALSAVAQNRGGGRLGEGGCPALNQAQSSQIKQFSAAISNSAVCPSVSVRGKSSRLSASASNQIILSSPVRRWLGGGGCQKCFMVLALQLQDSGSTHRSIKPGQGKSRYFTPAQPAAPARSATRVSLSVAEFNARAMFPA